MIRIDAHQHFWKLDRGDYGWLTPDLTVLYRDYRPEDLLPHLNKHMIDGTIVVQAAPTVEETEYLLDLYDRYAFIIGVVGWLDLEDPEFISEFRRLRRHKGFVGIRPMIQDIEDERWILRPQVLKHIGHLVEEEFPLDLLVLPKHLPYIIELLRHYPKLRAVVNHAAKPNIREGVLDPWRDHMYEIASYETVMCKLSGLVTEADHDDWTPADLAPYIRHVVDVFGVEAIMYGSDWPVCRLAGEYDDVYTALCEVLPQELTVRDHEKLFGGNAARFYKVANKLQV